MADYKKALQEGFEAAKKADLARKEIAEALAKLKADLLAGSDGKLLVEVREYEEEEENPYAQIVRRYSMATMGKASEPKKTFRALIATNPIAAQQSVKELARWKQSKDGYPCSLIWNKQERQFEDRAALEEGLAELLRDPRVGEKLYMLINQK